jgi:hypothetical protein
MDRHLTGFRQRLGHRLVPPSYEEETVRLFHTHLVSQVAEGLSNLSDQSLDLAVPVVWNPVAIRGESAPQPRDSLLGVDQYDTRWSGGEEEPLTSDAGGLVQPIQRRPSGDDPGGLQADVRQQGFVLSDDLLAG